MASSAYKKLEQSIFDYNQNPTDENAEKLDECLLPYYTITAKRYEYAVPGYTRDDLIQECRIFVFRSIKNYDPNIANARTFCLMVASRHLYSLTLQAQSSKHKTLNSAKSIDDVSHNRDEEGTSSLEPIAPELEDLYSDQREKLKYLIACKMVTPLEMSVITAFSEMPSGNDADNEQSYMYYVAEKLGITVKAVDNAMNRLKVKARKLFGAKPAKSKRKPVKSKSQKWREYYYNQSYKANMKTKGKTNADETQCA